MESYVVLDIETTGLYYEAWDEPIEVCAIKYIGDKEEIFHEYLKPYKKVPAKIEQLTKITNSFLENKENKYKVLPKLRAFIGDLPVIAHNVTFDVPFLNYWFNFLGLPLITKRFCTLKAFKQHTGQKRANLTAATDYFSICIYQAHSAIEDTRATYKLFKVMNKMYDLQFTEMTELEAYLEFMKRVCKSNSHKSIREVLCDSKLSAKPEGNKTYTDEEIIECFNNFNTPMNVYTKTTHEYIDIVKMFVNWLNNINVSKFYKYISNQSVYKYAKSLVHKVNSFDELIELHKALYGVDDINLFYYAIVYRLEKEEDKMTYTLEDFDYYFSRGTSIEELAKKIKRDEKYVIDFFVEWAFKKRQEKADVIKTYIVGIKELRNVLANGAKSSAEKVTLSLYNKKFFNIVL